MFGLQYQLPGNMVVEASYVGNHGLKLPFGSSFQRNQLDPKYLSLGNALLDPVPNPFFGTITTGSLSGPTIPRGQLLRPYPQFGDVNAAQPPAGMSNYNALNVSANRRFSNGLQFLLSYTWSKYLTNTEGNEGWTNGNAQSVRNWYDISSEKSLMINDIPHSFVASYIYEIPVGHGRKLAPENAVVEAVVGGWQLAGVTSLKSGFPCPLPRRRTTQTRSAETSAPTWWEIRIWIIRQFNGGLIPMHLHSRRHSLLATCRGQCPICDPRVRITST